MQIYSLTEVFVNKKTFVMPHNAGLIPCIFLHDNANSQSADITKAWLRKNRVEALHRSVWSPDLDPVKEPGEF